MNCLLPKLCALALFICLFGYLKTVSCDSPDPNSSIFHPIISYDVRVIRDNSSISSFVSAFAKNVYESDILYDLFDLSQTSASQLKDHISYDLKLVVNEYNLDYPDIVAEFSSRDIDQNFKVVTRDVAIRVYVNIAANYAYSIGVLNENTAESLAKKYTDDLTETAKKYVDKDDPTTKFDGIGKGSIKFVTSLKQLTQNAVWKCAFQFQSQYLLASVQVGGSNDIYGQCLKKVNK
ncbi:uncharacterized protein NPIL_581281 [Nephila pilipes]|uniref:Uncharacterized protein n=1 Tax=Nephila pilipes TaxID=299642 RepID=A0A8X6TAB6_NEPPI|nr:uncharacterized protein NPIL_581281 [Nephila pilipes]